MKLTKYCLLFTLALAAGSSTHAHLKLPALFADDMVIQRSTNAPIWGWADPDVEVTVTASWGSSAKAVAGDDGRWVVHLKTPEAGGPHTIELEGGTSITLKNVLSGDVWVCSGQSNMEWALANTLNAKEEIEKANYPMIRHFDMARASAAAVTETYKGTWYKCRSDVAARFSGVAYFFGREIHTQTDVPIGLLSINWGGTRIEPWIPEVGFRSTPELKRENDELDRMDPTSDVGHAALSSYLTALKAWLPQAEQQVAQRQALPPVPEKPDWVQKVHQNQNSTWTYNAMIEPILPFAIKGAIWYQGESNGGETRLGYGYKMKALITGWRSVWEQGDFPFYTVQLPNFQKSNPDLPAGGDGWTRVRQAQLDTLKLPNTGVAVAIDVGEGSNLHPPNKQEVGQRLAQWSLAKDYGKDIVPSGPIYKQLVIEGNKAILTFDHVGRGLMVGKKQHLSLAEEDEGAALTWFAIAGADKNWRWAKAVIDGDTVVVSSEKVPAPVAVRYAYAMHPEGCNLYNKDGLPASPFTTEK